jgi:hypothetical protein
MTAQGGPGFASRIAIIVGAAGSLALLLYAGRSNTHLLITLLFIVWVLAPFALLAVAERRSGSWSRPVQTTLHAMTLIIAAGSLGIYAYRAAFPPRSTGAFLFVIVPPVSVVLVSVALAIASLMSRPSRKESL